MIPPSCLYFAFPDGVFDHVCKTCTKVCCRHGGRCFGNGRREVPELVARFPELAMMVSGRQGDVVEFAIPTGACILLDEDGLCSAHRQYTTALKPEGCVLFPFNVLTPVGTAVAVSPNFLCPLELHVPARPGEVQGTHAALQPALESSAQLHNARFLATTMKWNHWPEAPRPTLAREAAFRDACAAAIGRDTFLGTLRGHAGDAGLFEAAVERAAALLQLSDHPAAPSDLVDDQMHALASVLRLDMLFLDAETRLVALALHERWLRRAHALSAHGLTVQRAVETLKRTAPALRLAARGQAPLPPLRGAVNHGVPNFLDAEMTFAAIKILHSIGSGRGTLEVLEEAMGRLHSATDRLVLLTTVGSAIEGRLGPLKRARSR